MTQLCSNLDPVASCSVLKESSANVATSWQFSYATHAVTVVQPTISLGTYERWCRCRSDCVMHADTKTTQAYLQDTQAHLLMQAVPRDTSVLVQQLGGEMNLSKLVMQRLMASATTW